MSQPTTPKSTLDDIRELLIDFGLPCLVLLITGILLFCGKDSEIKTIFAAAAGWLFKSGYTRRRKEKQEVNHA